MQSSRRLLSAHIVVMLLVGIVPSAEAQTASSGLKATVAVRITPTRQSDRPGGSAVSSDFLPGESKRLNLTAGRGNDLCETGLWAIEPGVTEPPGFQARIAEQEAAALYVWHFQVGMLEVATDRIVFHLSWERLSRSTPSHVLHGNQRITVREGQAFPIDLIHGEQNKDCVNVVVDVIAYVQDDPGSFGKTLEWDLWLSGPQSGPEHQTLTSSLGESASFRFEPVTVTDTQPSGKATSLTVDVYGELRGRMRSDGSIDVALTAKRGINSSKFRMRMRPELFRPRGNFGQKHFIIKPGETIKIVLPPVNPTPPVQFRTDPVTGERMTSAVPRPAQPAGASATNELSITIQARLR